MKNLFYFSRVLAIACAGASLLAMLTAHTTAQSAPESICPVPPYFSIRSQGQNEAREQAGLTNHTNIPTDHAMYGTFAVTPAFNRSFSPGHIAVPLFGRDLQRDSALQAGSVIGISGSKAHDRDPKDWLADYFYFPRTFDGSVSLEPRIQSLLVDFDFFLGMDSWAPGLFLRVQTPAVWTKWELNPCPATIPFSLITMFDTFSNLNVRAASDFFDYFCLENAPTSTLVAIQPLRYGKICGDCRQTEASVADVHADLGWNFLMEDDYHLGIFARAVAPTGNRPTGKFFFEPIVGNGHRVELGGGLDGHVNLWRSDELERYHLDLMLHADITHMFKAHQTYVFDLCNKPFSRYMIAGKITGPSTVSMIAPVANLTHCTVTVSPTTQTDIVAMLTLSADYFDWNIGYNFWATGCQSVCPDQSSSCCANCLITKEPWALVALKTTAGTLSAVNNGGDIHQIIPDDSGAPLTPITTKNIDYAAATQRGRSNKFFMHLNFSWYDHERWVPYIGAGAEIEFGARDTCGTKGNRCYARECCSSCNCCRTCAVYQWGVWAKSGVSF